MAGKHISRLALIGERQAELQGRTVNYRLKQSLRIRGIRLEIHRDSGLTVVVPGRYSQRHVQDILNEKSGWILRHLPADEPRQLPLFLKEADHGERLPFMGKMLKVVVRDSGDKGAPVRLEGNRLILSTAASRAKALENWYRQEAAHIFTQKADSFQQSMGLRYKKIVIRGQRKRWASASPTGNLSVNWKLLMAPEAIIDYVIMHELAHLKYMDHSRKFWDFLSRFCPDWKHHRKWLIAHEDELKSSATFKF